MTVLPDAPHPGSGHERTSVMGREGDPDESVEAQRDDEIMRLPDVLRAVGLSRSTIYRLMERKAFPGSVPLTGERAIGWRRGDVRGWLADRRRV